MDGRLEASFNSDRTQVIATIHPASGGKEVTSQDVVERLKAMGVVFGIREGEISKAVKWVSETGTAATKIVVAQGVLPENGQDAQITWKIDRETMSKPLPKTPQGTIDLPSIERARRVAAGTTIATIMPAKAGSPGKTITADLKPVPQTPGKNATLSAGPGVEASPDGLTFTATVDGFLEVKGDHISVHETVWIVDDLDAGTHTFRGCAVIFGNLLRGGTIEASGSVACLGTLAGVSIRSKGDVFLGKAARSRIAANGAIRISGIVKNCELVARGEVYAADGASVSGGSITTTQDIDLFSAGDLQFGETRLNAGTDGLALLLHEENQAETARCEVNANRIASTLRPMMSGGAQALPPEKREILVKLQMQRNDLEERIRKLLNEKRNLMMPPPIKKNACIRVRDVIHPGVCISFQDCALPLKESDSAVEFRRNGGSIERHRIQTAVAA